MNQNSGEVIPFSEVKRYLSVTFKDGNGEPYASSICSDTEMFQDTQMASNPEKTLLESEQNKAVQLGLICPMGIVQGYERLKI